MTKATHKHNMMRRSEPEEYRPIQHVEQVSRSNQAISSLNSAGLSQVLLLTEVSIKQVLDRFHADAVQQRDDHDHPDQTGRRHNKSQ